MSVSSPASLFYGKWLLRHPLCLRYHRSTEPCPQSYPTAENLPARSDMIRTRNTWRLWFAGVVIVAGAAVGVVFYVTRTFPGPQPALAREYPHEDEEPPATPTVVAVDVVRPQKGMDYEVEQPGSVHAYETVQLHAKVSGFLKEQKVDIGDRVKKG